LLWVRGLQCREKRFLERNARSGPVASELGAPLQEASSFSDSHKCRCRPFPERAERHLGSSKRLQAFHLGCSTSSPPVGLDLSHAERSSVLYRTAEPI